MNEQELESRNKYKQKSLEIGEKHLKIAIDDVLEFAQLYVDDTSTPLDDTFLEGIKLLKSSLVEVVDKIDGIEGN